MPEPDGIEIATVWVGVDEVPVQLANQFVAQKAREEFIISVGHAAPPMLIGSPDEVKEQAKMIDYVPIRPIARLGLTQTTLTELIAVLQAIAKHDGTDHD